VFVLLVYNLYSFRVSQSDFKTLSTSDHSYPSHERQYWPIHLPRLKLRVSRQPLCLFKSVLRLPIQQLTPCMPLPVWSAISNIQTIAVCEQALLQLTAQNISPLILKLFFVIRDFPARCPSMRLSHISLVGTSEEGNCIRYYWLILYKYNSYVYFT